MGYCRLNNGGGGNPVCSLFCQGVLIGSKSLTGKGVGAVKSRDKGVGVCVTDLVWKERERVM